MWQRKQTIFLGITALSLVLSVFFPIWTAVDGSEQKLLYPLHYTVKTVGEAGEMRVASYIPYALTAIFLIAAATIAIVEIGKFENRLLQLKLAALNSLLMAAGIGSSIYFAIQIIKLNQVAGAYDFGLWLQPVAMISNMIANRFIRKDEKLVRDSNRIR